ncbi:MAG: hypothetical protein P9X22_06620 [Candidatus Zapsychrus exili]|nr:hypothetical protein [Candidatus Zapsychrus exili]
MVHTVRTKRRGEGKIKLLITKIGYRILHSISSLKIPIETGDFKLLTRRAIDHLISFKEKRPFIRGLVCWIGFNQARVFYVRPPRAAGKTKFSVFGLKVISNFLESALISFSSTPLQVSSIFAVFLIVTSIGFFIASFMFKANAVVLSIVAAIFFVGSIILFCLGIIGFYLTNIFEETKKRPNYIIDSTYGFKE